MISFKPIYKSSSGPVVNLKYNNGCGAMFAFTDLGKIVRIKNLPYDFMGRGLTNVFCQILNGEGDFSSLIYDSCYYDLYQAIALLNSRENTYSFIQSDVRSFSAFKHTKVTALYVSDVLKADEDFGFWKTITWRQTSSDSRVTVAIKVANTEEELLKTDWQYYISKESPDLYGQSQGLPFTVTESLNRFNLKGRFLMFKVEMETADKFDNPIVGDFIISYASKHSVFFFTRKIKITKTSNIDNLIFTANLSEPEKTEVKFGITNSNSADWEDYKIITLDQLVSLPSDYGNSVKIGVKMSSYSETKYPVVQEFSFLVGSESEDLLNKT